MPPKLALSLSGLFILFVISAERRRNAQVSSALIWPLLWYAITASMPVSAWLTTLGVPVSSGDFREGTTFDGGVYGFLILMGMRVLGRRRCDWAAVWRENAWFLILFGFIGLSIVWSDYPFVSLKRAVKCFGAAVMVLVVLTEPKPQEAIAAVLRRCAYFIIPLSIVTIKYYPDTGIVWDWEGDAPSWTGVTTSKNILGQVAMVSTLYFLIERIRWQGKKEHRMIVNLYILMSLYLLKGSDSGVSMTSLSVLSFGLFVYWVLKTMKLHPGRIKPFVTLICVMIFSLLLTLIWHTLSPFSESSLMGKIILAMGRDITLTSRTEIWNGVLGVAALNPIIGVGYGAFWIGRLANIPWTLGLTWTLGQAHNGYLDTYLQLGWAGIFLLMSVLISSLLKIVRAFQIDFEYSQFRMTFFLMILFVNITESSFLRGDHNLWFLFLLVALTIPHTNEQIGQTLARKGTCALT
jgi:exopolysaccharide production protein ExoQ